MIPLRRTSGDHRKLFVLSVFNICILSVHADHTRRTSRSFYPGICLKRVSHITVLHGHRFLCFVCHAVAVHGFLPSADVACSVYFVLLLLKLMIFLERGTPRCPTAVVVWEETYGIILAAQKESKHVFLISGVRTRTKAS